MTLLSGKMKKTTLLTCFTLVMVLMTTITSFAQQAFTVGAGDQTTYWPFRGAWANTRTDILYTADELNAQGMSAGNITCLGFNTSNAYVTVMDNFTIRMQNSPVVVLEGFVDDGWTQVFSGNLSINGTGWQMLPLNTAFGWDGYSNILIEITHENLNANATTSSEVPRS